MEYVSNSVRVGWEKQMEYMTSSSFEPNIMWSIDKDKLVMIVVHKADVDK